VLLQGLAQMDQWLTNLSKDSSGEAPIAKLRRAKPADLVDACWNTDETPRRIVEKQQYRAGQCNELYPAFSYPRGIAGAPIANDVIKCQLKSLSAADYKVTFTPDEMTRLRRIFPSGVCDWTKPGMDQQRLTGTWQVFKAGNTAGTQ
jgi:hypothetical protein